MHSQKSATEYCTQSTLSPCPPSCTLEDAELPENCNDTLAACFSEPSHVQWQNPLHLAQDAADVLVHLSITFSGATSSRADPHCCFIMQGSLKFQFGRRTGKVQCGTTCLPATEAYYLNSNKSFSGRVVHSSDRGRTCACRPLGCPCLYLCPHAQFWSL